VVSLNYKVKHIKKHYSTRPGIKLLRLQALVDHWTANFGATAQGHFKYFDETLPNQNDIERAAARKAGREERIRYASAHIFVDRNEAIELVPLDEVCFHANDRTLQLPTLRASTPEYRGGNANLLTVGIEMCVEKNGTIHPDTIERTRLVIKMLQEKFTQLKDTKNRVVRHYDVTGKPCPLPFVEDEQKWNAFLYSVDQPVKTQSVEKPKEEVKVVENAIIINSVNDYPAAELLAKKINCPIYPDKRTFAESKDKVNHMYVVGGDKDGIKADKITLLSGPDRLATYAAVKKAL
jgi:N-acetylmuramoyl-L-alanine amidase CwlA